MENIQLWGILLLVGLIWMRVDEIKDNSLFYQEGLRKENDRLYEENIRLNKELDKARKALIENGECPNFEPKEYVAITKDWRDGAIPKGESEEYYYTLSCDRCCYIWKSKEAFPKKCPKCHADRRVHKRDYILTTYTENGTEK